MSKSQGHWVGLTVDIGTNFGFIYIITDMNTGQKYVGKKQCFFTKTGAPKCRGKVNDRGSTRWKDSCWKESNWKKYKGSSNILKDHMKKFPKHTYEYRVVRLCRSKGALTYSEVEVMWELKVLSSKLPDGEYEYFNRQIGAIKYRPPAYMFDKMYKFIHGEGWEAECSIEVMANMWDLNKAALKRLIAGKQATHKGWSVWKTKE